MNITIIPVEGIGEVAPGDDVAALIVDALPGPLVDGDIVVVTHKIVSKAEGAITEAPTDADRRRIVEEQATAVIRRRGDLTIAVTAHGFICANAGVDRSNVAPGMVVLLPERPDRSAHLIRRKLEAATGTRLGVVITDTFGRPWRRGLTDVAIGISGLPAIVDYRGTADTFDQILEVTEVAVADEIAAAADLVMGKASGVPAAIVRGLDLTGEGRATDLVRAPDEDLFR
ncbi:MAG: coenzyme F420-0:L-glutamate ligase [Acidimicrobiia bacterium]|nr:coenzyme F420-0:L-glutamate ligase [Acidimicrobiia bacterium]